MTLMRETSWNIFRVDAYRGLFRPQTFLEFITMKQASWMRVLLGYLFQPEGKCFADCWHGVFVTCPDVGGSNNSTSDK